jgi:hypothetical protein
VLERLASFEVQVASAAFGDLANLFVTLEVAFLELEAVSASLAQEMAVPAIQP